ncbi:class C sortase [Lacticaseibacillus hegangensis]|uniref:Class C sortase n=1 Tax=Lacticaseibacillus hegangensis TaxID=2486010 RepID=A0ABW4CWH0_9LACO|nr:class C sortase [Lacticaseibacillus hegangensis]
MTYSRLQRRRTRRRYHLFFTLFIIGALLLIVPLAYSKAVQHHELTLANQYQHAQVKSGALKAARRYNADIYARQQGQPVKYHQSIKHVQKNLKRPLGFVRIPAIHLISTPIYFGDSDRVLAKGTGIMGGTSLPVGGTNTLSVVSGHSGLANRVIFDNIRYLKRGDVFYFSALGGPEIAYRVYKRLIVDPTKPHATDVVKVQPGKDRAVLLTCTPIFVNSHRLLIYGKRVPIAAAKSTATHARDAFTPLNIWLYAISLLMILFIIWFMVTELRDRHLIAKRS